MRSAGGAEAVSVVDGAATATASWPVTAAAPVTLIAKGLGEHVTPAGNPAAGQVTFTLPKNPPLGVTVMVDITLAPAVPVTALPPTVKVPVLAFTVKLTLFEVPPPGAGFVTVTAGVPALAMSAARTEAVS